jgi:hypothetical protein
MQLTRVEAVLIKKKNQSTLGCGGSGYYHAKCRRTTLYVITTPEIISS